MLRRGHIGRLGRTAGVSACLIAAGLVATFSAVPAQSQGGPAYGVSWWTVDNGGATFGTGAGYRLGGTAGQADAGRLTGAANLTVQGGFWGIGTFALPPVVPTGLDCAAACDTRHPLGAWTIHLWWTNRGGDASDVHIYRASGDAGEREIITVPAGGSSYIDRGVVAGQAYVYRIRSHRHRDDRYSVASAIVQCQTR